MCLCVFDNCWLLKLAARIQMFLIICIEVLSLQAFTPFFCFEFFIGLSTDAEPS